MRAEEHGRLHGAVERAQALCRELTAVYDEVESRLRAGAWDDLGVMAGRIAASEQALAPLVETIAAVRAKGGPALALAPLWSEIDGQLESLARRVSKLEDAATAARDATATRLAQSRLGRVRTRSYGAPQARVPRLTSGRV